MNKKTKEFLEELIDQDKSIDDIASLLDMKRESTFNLLRRHGLKCKNNKKSAAEEYKHHIIELYLNQNKTALEISEIFPLSKDVIWQSLKKWGIKAKTKGERVKVSLTKDQENELISLISDGYSFNLISKTMGLTKDVIIQRCRELNIRSSGKKMSYCKAVCKYCSKPIIKKSKKIQYCSEECKVKQFYIDKYGKYEFECENCKNKFIPDYYSDHTRFCSKNCSGLIVNKGSEKIKRGLESYKKTCLVRFGIDHPMKLSKYKDMMSKANKIAWKKIDKNSVVLKHKRTCLKKYNVENYTQSEEYASRLEEIQEKNKRTCLKKYNVENYTQSEEYASRLEEIQEKSYQTKKANNSFNTSKPEQEIYEYLKKEFPHVKYQYKSESYPSSCDFYIPHLDLYIEYNGSWTHGTEPFDINNPNHLDIVETWNSKNTDYYRNALQVWTMKDPEKREIAKANNLNYLELWTSDYKLGFEHIKSKIDKFYKPQTLPYRELTLSYTRDQLVAEFNSIPRGYDSLPRNNRIILQYQGKEFYRVENDLWKDEKIRERIVSNRMKYLNIKHGSSKPVGSPEELTDNKILTGFKISGIHIGYSHFSSGWIASFIEDYDIKSIYDPCGGWGHRLLGAKNIRYIYNDINEKVCLNIQKIIKDFNMKDKLVYNNDASEFIPKEDYECVFTCPPYYNTEIYDCDNTSTSKYPSYSDWLNIWWDSVVKCSLKSEVKYFCFVINNKYLNDMVNVCKDNNLEVLDIKEVGGSLNHFQRNSKSIQKGEKLVIMKPSIL